MHASLDSFTHGTAGFALLYLCAMATLVASLVRHGASLKKFIAAPILAVAVVLVVGLVSVFTGPLLGLLGSFVQLLGSIVIAAVAGWFAGLWWTRRGSSAGDVHQRGAVVNTAGGVGRPLAAGICLAGVAVPAGDETKHFKIIGTTGTGKSTAINEVLAGALARGDRAIIADPDGGYLDRYYDPTRGDVILNPFDERGRHWDFFGEIDTDYDVEQIARSLIPNVGDSDATWTGYARTLFTSVTQQLMLLGKKDEAELVRLLLTPKADELRMLLRGTAAGPFVAEGNDRMFGSINSVMSSALSPLRYTTRQQAPPLSVRRWIRNPARTGVLFMPYSAGEIAALASIISAWMRLGIFEAMEQPVGDQLLWFIIDELDALGTIDGLKDALARLRKFGGRCVLGLQSIGQVSRLYGRETAGTIIENCGNSLILRCSASEHGGTAEFASRLIGQREVLRTTRSRTRRPFGWAASITHSEQIRIEPAVMASEVERLPDLQGFLKVASEPDWRLVKLLHPGPVESRRSTAWG